MVGIQGVLIGKGSPIILAERDRPAGNLEKQYTRAVEVRARAEAVVAETQKAAELWR